MLQLEEALARILAAVPPPVAEPVPLSEAHGRILTEPVLCPIDLPPFDNSAMDGYAVRAADLEAATTESPARLRVIGRVAAGESFAAELAAGECVRLFTGSPLPRSADAVVMQEDTRPIADAPGEILVLDRVRPWENVRFAGEDLKRGAALAETGSRVTSCRLGLFGAAGMERVRVGHRPTVGLLATGSELVEPGQPLGPGQIYESNRLALTPLISRSGALPRIWPVVRDDLAGTRLALEQALSECDAVITSGGVSVGELDFVKRALTEQGGDLQIWKVAIKPGRPFVFGRCRGKFLFGLPGNPVSAVVTFLLLVRPALLRWQGAVDVQLPAHPGVLAEPLPNPGERRHFFRVKVDAAGRVHSAGIQASHILASLAAADGLVDVPPATTLPAGSSVQVLRWED
jgi:molybdopterin molybdotransferase